MKKYILALIVILLCTSFTKESNSEECDVSGFYRSTDVPYGVKALNDYDELIDIKYLLVPDNEIKAGRYNITINKVDDNLYQVVGTDLYLETKLCIELGLYDDAILNVINYQGHKFGSIIFKD